MILEVCCSTTALSEIGRCRTVETAIRQEDAQIKLGDMQPVKIAGRPVMCSELLTMKTSRAAVLRT